MSIPLGPQWHQLPMLMTPQEVSRLDTNDYPGRSVSQIAPIFKHDLGHRHRGREGDPPTDQDAVTVLRNRFQESGYNENYPVMLMHKDTVHGPKVRLMEGHHRAVAAVEENLLTPVVHHLDHGDLLRERNRQRVAWLGE